MFKVSQRVIDKKWKKIVKNFPAFNNVVLKVGIQKDAGANSEGESIAEYAAKNEYGSRQIPERSFIRSTLDEKRHQIFKLIANEFDKALILKQNPQRALETIGTYVETEIKRKITSLRQPFNSPVTIKRKGSTNPLIDTGLMRQSIRYNITKE